MEPRLKARYTLPVFTGRTCSHCHLLTTRVMTARVHGYSADRASVSTGRYYLREEGYVFVVVCLFVCPSVR